MSKCPEYSGASDTDLQELMKCWLGLLGNPHSVFGVEKIVDIG